MRLLENYEKKVIMSINNPNYDHYAKETHQTWAKREPETKPKYCETVVPRDGIRWWKDPRMQRIISDGFLLPLSHSSGMGVSPWFVDPNRPLLIHSVFFQQQGWCWGHRNGHMVGAACAPLPLCPEQPEGMPSGDCPPRAVPQPRQHCRPHRTALDTSAI